ncbi:hypothetical protein ZWY2020_031474 [Hordeum vulgare]|nr:hypothetical protein ZWY2020_031474 [Hordeum vulgare]
MVIDFAFATGQGDDSATLLWATGLGTVLIATTLDFLAPLPSALSVSRGRFLSCSPDLFRCSAIPVPKKMATSSVLVVPFALRDPRGLQSSVILTLSAGIIQISNRPARGNARAGAAGHQSRWCASHLLLGRHIGESPMHDVGARCLSSPNSGTLDSSLPRLPPAPEISPPMWPPPDGLQPVPKSLTQLLLRLTPCAISLNYDNNGVHSRACEVYVWEDELEEYVQKLIRAAGVKLQELREDKDEFIEELSDRTREIRKLKRMNKVLQPALASTAPVEAMIAVTTAWAGHH